MTELDPIDRLREAIDSGDPGRVADCFTSDYVSELPHRPSQGFTGSDRVAENWTRIFAGFPALRAHVLRRAQNGAEVWSEWELRDTSDGKDRVVMAGPVIMNTHESRISWSRFYISPVEAGQQVR